MAGRLLIVEWDAADWKVLHPLMDDGKMPALNRLVDEGVSGELLSVQPLVPALVCTSLMTGKRAWKHGICHSMELTAQGRPATISASVRRTAALWQMLAHAKRRCIVAGWPATHNETADQCFVISDRYHEPTAGPGIKPWPPAAPGTYWPNSIHAQLDSKRVSPEQIDASVISNYIPEWRKIDQQRDRRIGRLRQFLAADYSYHAGVSELLKREQWDFAAVRYPALGAISQVFLPFHLTRSETPASPEAEFYRSVVEVACRILDNMLNELLVLAGSETTVMLVSTHGVRTQGVPPGGFAASDQESWKSPFGIFAAKGTQLACDALVFGASVLDVTPTVLSWAGLPIGDDMEGRILIEAFHSPPQINRIESWDSQIGIQRQSPPDNPSSSQNHPAASAWRRDADWLFAQSALEAARYSDALPVLNRLFREFPERVEVSHALFQCHLALNQLPDATETLEVLLEALPPGAPALLARAELAVVSKDFRQARGHVTALLQLQPTQPHILRRLGLLLVRLRDWDALEQIANRALNLNQQEPLAWLGLATAQLRKGKLKEAEESSARAIRLKYFMPDAHFILARALVLQGRWREAADAFEALLKIQPQNGAAAAYLKRIPPNSVA